MITACNYYITDIIMWLLERQNIKISKPQNLMVIFKQNNEIISCINHINKFSSKILAKQLKTLDG